VRKRSDNVYAEAGGKSKTAASVFGLRITKMLAFSVVALHCSARTLSTVTCGNAMFCVVIARGNEKSQFSGISLSGELRLVNESKN